MESLYNFMTKKAPAFDNRWFLNNEKNQIRAAHFFFYTSHITAFFLFSKIGKIILSLFAAITFYFSSDYFKTLVAAFADFEFLNAVQFMVLNVPLILVFLVVFVIFLMDLALINTFLILCSSVSSRIKLLYGENFLKKQYYNSAFASAKAASQMSKHLAVGVAGGLVAGTITNMFGEYMYAGNYNKYLEAKINNPNLDLKPPTKGHLLGINFGR